MISGAMPHFPNAKKTLSVVLFTIFSAPALSTGSSQHLQTSTLHALLPESVKCCDLLHSHDENILLKTGLVDGNPCEELNCMQHARMKLFIRELGVMMESCSKNEDQTSTQRANTTKLEDCDSKTLSDILTFAYIGRHWTTMGDVSSQQTSYKYFQFDSEFDRLEPRHMQCEFNEIMYLVVLIMTVVILLFTLTIDAVGNDQDMSLKSHISNISGVQTDSREFYVPGHYNQHTKNDSQSQLRPRKSVYEIIGSHVTEHYTRDKIGM
jgi:hypothetical protein